MRKKWVNSKTTFTLTGILAKALQNHRELLCTVLQRKSLRDQWLMEGNPLSPLSPNTQNTFSSLWGTQEQDMEKHADRLQSEDQQVTAQKDHEMEALKEAETKAENIFNVSENGDSTALRHEPAGDEVKVNQNTPQGETAVILTNGEDVSGQSETGTIEPAGTTKDASNAEMESEMSATATALCQVPKADTNEEEDGTLVMRAECVYITDEGDDVSGDLSSLKDQQEFTQNPEGVQEIVEVVEQVAETEGGPETGGGPEAGGAPETSPVTENGEAAVLTVKDQLTPEDRGDIKGDTEPSGQPDEETEVEGRDEKREESDCPQPPTALDSGAVSLVPVYAEASPSALISETEAEAKAETPAAPEVTGEAVKVEEPACILGQFQEVLLTDSQDNQNTEAEPGEQEALLQKISSPNLNVELAGPNSLPCSETQSPSKATQGEKSETLKQQTCQCCSVM
ncbi:paralemmin-3 isoform X2 [Poecilia reticulata]|uniref:paralemmin-3 isoform X2 n=1 Tax=Poecilia reticulata TaxID=8081 RepID=UPI0004A353CD|nr:PREDICTED: immunoglobulin A1 protease autotransporter-like isoform X2 [Poecilia reticulata]